MKIGILGDGLLGSEIYKQTGWEYISRKKDGFDITKSENFGQHLIESYEGVAFVNKYDCLINCIAYTNTYSIDRESNWNVNYKGVADLVDFCNRWNIKLVQISTDYVYVNSKPNASEEDVPVHSDNWYSYTKLLGDAYVQLKCNNYLICRETHKPMPFPYDTAWVDQIGNFDYIDIIANNIVKLVNTNATGVFNIGTELKSVFELAKRTKVNVIPSLKPNHIPANVSLDTNKLQNWLLKNK